VTAGDLNTDDGFIERVIREDIGLTSCQHGLARAIADAGGRDRSGELAALNAAPATPYFPLIEAAVGYGLAGAIDEAVSLAAPALKSSSAAGKFRVIIQGFGAVGSSLAHFITSRCGATVKAIADKDGFVAMAPGAEGGLPVEDFLRARLARRAALTAAGASASTIAECSKNLICNLGDLGSSGSGGGQALPSSLSAATQARPTSLSSRASSLLLARQRSSRRVRAATQ
jgi:hypothetical protein